MNYAKQLLQETLAGFSAVQGNPEAGYTFTGPHPDDPEITLEYGPLPEAMARDARADAITYRLVCTAEPPEFLDVYALDWPAEIQKAVARAFADDE